jgi:chromosome segregation ATPase
MATEAEQLRKQLAEALEANKVLVADLREYDKRFKEMSDEITNLKRKLAAANEKIAQPKPVESKVYKLDGPAPTITLKPEGQAELVAKAKSSRRKATK